MRVRFSSLDQAPTFDMHIKFYYAAGTNCCERVRWALDYKRVPYEMVDLDQPHDEVNFAAISPFARVPVMELNGIPLTESMAMVELLEEIVPSPPLNYSDCLSRARVREVCEAVNSSIHPVQNSSVVQFFRPEWSKNEMRPVRANWIANNLAKLQARLWLDSGFAVGTAFTFADIFVAAIFRKGVSLGIERMALPEFNKHWSFLMSQPSVRASCPLSDARAVHAHTSTNGSARGERPAAASGLQG